MSCIDPVRAYKPPPVDTCYERSVCALELISSNLDISLCRGAVVYS